MVNFYKTDKSTKYNWTWEKIIKDILLIGEENLSILIATSQQNVQLGNVPGTRFQHCTDMLKDKDFPVGGNWPSDIIVAPGINDRFSDTPKICFRVLNINIIQVIIFLLK